MLRGEMELGLCKDICMPHSISFRAELPAEVTRPDPVIAASIASIPFSASEAGVGAVSCDMTLGSDGITLNARVEMPSAGGQEFVVVETRNPMVWVDEAETRRSGGALYAETELMHMEGKPFALDRSGLTITVIGKNHAVEIHGCS